MKNPRSTLHKKKVKRQQGEPWHSAAAHLAQQKTAIDTSNDTWMRNQPIKQHAIEIDACADTRSTTHHQKLER